MNPLAQRLQALLFLSGDAMGHDELLRLLACDREQLATAAGELRTHLVDSGLALIETDHEMQLTTSAAVASVLTTLQEESTDELSSAAAETLALVAYRGPISRIGVDAIRGVDSSRALRQLSLRGLVHRAKDGVRYTYQVAPEFLRQVGLEHVSQLPEYETLSSAEAVQKLLDT